MSTAQRWTIIAAFIAALGLTVWGCFGLNHSLILAVDQARTDEHLLALDAHEAIQSGKPIIADLQTIVHNAAHPSTGEKIVSSIAKFVPHIF